jgi:hypothetical protein
VGFANALKLVTALRGAGFSVGHGLNAERYMSQATRNQVDGAKKAGVCAVIYFTEHGTTEAMNVMGSMKGAATYTIDTAAALAGDAAAMQGLRDWLHRQRAQARSSSGNTATDG